MFIGCGWHHCLIITEDKTLWVWGKGLEGQAVPDGTYDQHTPVPIISPPSKFAHPEPSPLCKGRRYWRDMYSWIWLGRMDEESLFAFLHVEVVFHFVSCTLKAYL
jgi:hypothetical protein